MRRSAAPSLNARPLKRSKFSTPFRNVAQQCESSPSTSLTAKKEENHSQERRENSRQETNKVAISSSDSNDASLLDSAPKYPTDTKEKTCQQPQASVMKTKFVTPTRTINSSEEKKDHLSNRTYMPENSPSGMPVENEARYLNVVWGKVSKKKHKKWDGDGILVLKGRQAVLRDLDGKDIAKTSSYRSSELTALKEGESLSFCGKEIEVMSVLPKEDFTSGRCFNQNTAVLSPSSPALNNPGNNIRPKANKPFAAPKMRGESDDKDLMPSFKRKPLVEKARHNPDAVGAIVMPRPGASHQWQFNKQGHPVVDVVLDPFITSHLRPHQVEGVTFLYKCVMGMGNFAGSGAILADEMGLGKTLQCITLIWTLLKQGAYGGKSKHKRFLIVTPGSLVKNWCAEIQKWLGNERLKTFAVSSEKRVEEFCKSSVYPVMIISYEMLLRCLPDIKKVNFDLIVCDEAHRLKNVSIKTSSAIAGLGISGIVLLTGTPIQNDLKEFYALADLCNPGVFGSSASFRRNFEAPIIRSQDPGCSLEEKSLGDDRAAELKRLTDLFVLRRTSELNQKFLPPKVELVVFCDLSVLQRRIYSAILSSKAVSSCLSTYSNGSSHLNCISVLRKLCNHPSLLLPMLEEVDDLKKSGVANEENIIFDGLLSLYPDQENIRCPENSGKLVVLVKLIDAFREAGEKCVIVANSTKALDIFELFLTSKGRKYARLDGTTPTRDRQRLVDNFNKRGMNTDVFLLSSKAGGTGLNLIGASRLVLFDIDWNPANDMQAMARVWRDGQRRKVFIYRLLSTGTIEEKIFQRQISKQSLSGNVVDLKKNKMEFSKEDLKDLFKLEDTAFCCTHDLLGCLCHETGEQELQQLPSMSHNRSCQLGQQNAQPNEKKSLSMAELMSWNHVLPNSPGKLQDDALRTCLDEVTFIFQNQFDASNQI